MRILVGEDDRRIAGPLATALTAAGFVAVQSHDGEDIWHLGETEAFDAVILDLGLPSLDGLTVLKRWRKAGRTVPVLILTARGQWDERVEGIETGADDYVVKPFKPKELVARVRARLRRAEDPTPEQLTIGDLVIDVAGHSVKRDGRGIALTPLEFDLLVALARKPRQVFTRELLLEQVWGYRHAADTRLVNVHVQRLRAKIERDPEKPEVVLTVRGVGYKAGPP